MTAKRDRSADEQVYQENKQEPAITEVYSNEAPSSGNDKPLNTADPTVATKQDEASAESFPASDPPSPSQTTTASIEGA